ncbi:60S acidic ribosomal protein P2-like [Arapaima gigas]
MKSSAHLVYISVSAVHYLPFRLCQFRCEHAFNFSLTRCVIPQAKDIKKILDSVGIETDESRMEKVISELNGKDVNNVITQGYGKLASMPVGGAVAVASSAAPAAGGAAAPAAAAEEKKEEKKEESEESDDDMGFGLFD